MLQNNFFKQTIDDLHKHVLYLIFYFQGEPYLNPDFLDMVAYANKKKIYTATSTNAHYLTDEMAKKTVESGLDRLIISVDGTTQDVYKQYRVGGNLEKVLEGAKNIVKWKKALNSKTPFVFFQFLVVKPNEHQIEEIKALAKQVGVDEVRFKTAQVYDYENDPNQLIPENEKYARYKRQKDGTYRLKYKTGNHCWRMWSSCVLTWDAQVVPCCFDKDAKHVLGSAIDENFDQLWKSKKYNDFRLAVLTKRNQIDICQNCSEGTKVWV